MHDGTRCPADLPWSFMRALFHSGSRKTVIKNAVSVPWVDVLLEALRSLMTNSSGQPAHKKVLPC
jgi:hypothetical protein